MSRKVSPLLPRTTDALRQFGLSLMLARRRRHITAKQAAERAGMAPLTLRHVERGEDGVTIGAYLAVMQVLGLEQEFLTLAKGDAFGRELQDAALLRPRDVNRPEARPRYTRRLGSGQLRPLEEMDTTGATGAPAGAITVEQLSALIKPVPPRAG